MGTAYKIRCKHCGAQIDRFTDVNYGVSSQCVGRNEYVETEIAIRCPVCHKRLNRTMEEFHEQVEVTYQWN